MNSVKAKGRRKEESPPLEAIESVGAFLAFVLAGWFDRPSEGSEWLSIKHGVFYVSLFLMYVSTRTRVYTPYILGLLANVVPFVRDTLTPGGTAAPSYGRELFLYLVTSALLLLGALFQRTQTKVT